MTAHEVPRTPSGLYVHESGQGPRVVFVHGVMDRSSGMLRARRIVQGQLRVVRYDRRGYGRSQDVPASDDFRRQADDLVEVLDGQPSVVIGHSFGGVVALAVAERRPDLVRSVATYEHPATRANGDGHEGPGGSSGVARATIAEAEGPAQAAEWFMRRMIGDQLWERLPPAMQADRRAEGPAMLADMRSIGPEAPAPFTPERVMVPLVAAYGDKAGPRRRRVAEDLVARAPHAELWVAPGGDHGIHLSDPRAFVDLVLRAVERAEDRRPAP